jgi:hypothetical protein
LESPGVVIKGCSITAETTRFESSRQVIFEACEVTLNSCSFDRSLVHLMDSQAEISGCTFSEGENGMVIQGKSSATISECTFQKFETSALIAAFPNELGLIQIEACTFLDCQVTAIGILGYRCEMRDCHISSCFRGVFCSQGADVALAHCTLTNIAEDGIHVIIASSLTVADSVVDQLGESGVFASQGSTADIRNCRITSAGHFGMDLGGASTAKLRDSTIASSGVAAISCYDHSRVNCSSCKLAGPTATGVDIFTGGCVKMKNSAIIGMANAAIWTHHAGYGTFTGMAFSDDPNHQTLPLEELLAMELTAEHIFRTESKRPLTIRIRGAETAIESCCQAQLPEP